MSSKMNIYELIEKSIKLCDALSSGYDQDAIMKMLNECVDKPEVAKHKERLEYEMIVPIEIFSDRFYQMLRLPDGTWCRVDLMEGAKFRKVGKIKGGK